MKCCDKSNIVRTTGKLELDNVSFPYVIMYCTNCGVVRNPSSDFYDGEVNGNKKVK